MNISVGDICKINGEIWVAHSRTVAPVPRWHLVSKSTDGFGEVFHKRTIGEAGIEVLHTPEFPQGLKLKSDELAVEVLADLDHHVECAVPETRRKHRPTKVWLKLPASRSVLSKPWLVLENLKIFL